MKNKNLHNLVSCFGLGDDGFGEARLCQKGATPPAGREAPKPSDGTPVSTEQVEPQTPDEIEAAKKKKEKRVAEETEKKKEELKAIVEGTQDRAEFRETEKFPVKINPMPEKPVWEMGQFLKIDLKDERDKLDRWTINVQREKYQINVQTWDHSTPEGLQKIYDDLKTLGIIDSSPDFYNTMFPVLWSAANKDNPWLGLDNGKYRPMFKNPTDRTSRDEIERLGKDGVFLGGEAFIKAYDHLQYIRAQVLIAQDKMQLETLSKQRKLDENFVADKTTGFVRDNLAAFQKAIRERDYATAGMYAVGIYAMYKVVGGLFGGGGGDEHGGGGGGFGKYLLWGAAIYAGNTFLKNAGYDVLKMAGLKDTDYDVKDTPMASLNGILGQSEYSEQMKDLDYGIVLRMSDTKLTTLQELFERSNKDGIQFIHPREFPGIFPDLKNVWPFKMGIGEQGLKDYIGMSNTKLGPNEKEYIRVGQQIYKLALAMRVTYDNTLHKDHEKYRGMTYDEALNGKITGKILGQSKVRHLMDAASDYAPGAVAEGWFSTKKRDEIEAKLNQDAFGKMPQEGFHLTEELGPGHFSGYLKDFPIVVVAEPDTFRIYLRNEYGKTYNRNPGRNYITKIPLGGADKELKAKEAVDGVKKRVEKLLERFEGVGGRSIVGTTLVYKGGKWQAKVTLPGAPKFDVTERGTMALITPDEFGDGVALETEGGVRINVKESLDKQYPVALAVIPKLVDQKEFRALAVFNNAGLLRLEDPDPKDDKVTLVIGKNRMKLEVEYKEDKNDFALDDYGNLIFDKNKGDFVRPKKFAVVGNSDVEKSLVQNPTFAQEYIEALDEDKLFELNETVDKLKKLVKESPQNFFPYLFMSLTGQTKESPLDGMNLDSLSGSVPAYFSHTVLDVTKYETLEKLRRAIMDAKNLDAVNSAYLNVMHDTNARLTAIYDILSKENLERDSWDRDEFVAGILFPVRSASTNSSAYTLAKGEFEYQVYGLLNGVLDHSDFSKVSHEKAGGLMKVFAYYTAYLDNPEYEYKNPNTKTDEKIKIDLDNLDWPAKQKFPGMDIKKDPGLRGHSIIRYFDYVKQEIVNRARGEKLEIIPDGSARNFWQIMDFDEWLEKKGSYHPLDPLDNMPKFTHDPDAAHGPAVPEANVRYTELEKAIASEFDKAVAILMAEYGTALNYHAIQAYLRAEYDPADPAKTVGIFRTDVDPVTKKEVCKLCQWADRIALEDKRSGQMHQIQELVYQSLIKHIFENPQDFFTKKISMKARILKKWPGLRDISFIPDWINPLAD